MNPALLMTPEDVATLQRQVDHAIDRFLNERPSLLELDVHEQAIAHRIAYHLEGLIADPSLVVDCEYNNHLENAKRCTPLVSKLSMEDLRTCSCPACEKIRKEGFPESKLFRPDIVVHRRGTDDYNTLVIELKKDKECPFDLEKLRCLTVSKASGGEFGYKLGLFVHFPNRKPRYRWFPGASIA